MDGLGEDPEDTELVSGMTGLAHALRLMVIAEGVETEEQLVQLRETGSEFAQGYHLARPLPGEAAGALLADQSSLKSFRLETDN